MDKELFSEIIGLKENKEPIVIKQRIPIRLIEQIMKNELEKPPEKMNTKLIEHCLDALTEKGSFQPKIKYYKSIIANFFVALIVLSIIVIFSYPAISKWFDIATPEVVSHFYDVFFHLDL